MYVWGFNGCGELKLGYKDVLGNGLGLGPTFASFECVRRLGLVCFICLAFRSAQSVGMVVVCVCFVATAAAKKEGRPGRRRRHYTAAAQTGGPPSCRRRRHWKFEF